MVAFSLPFPAPPLMGFSPLPGTGVVQQLPKRYDRVGNGSLEAPQVEVFDALGERHRRRPCHPARSRGQSLRVHPESARHLHVCVGETALPLHSDPLLQLLCRLFHLRHSSRPSAVCCQLSAVIDREHSSPTGRDVKAPGWIADGQRLAAYAEGRGDAILNLQSETA